MENLKDAFYDTFEEAGANENLTSYALIAAGILFVIWFILKYSERSKMSLPWKSEKVDISTLGRSSWMLLHTTAAKYPVHPDGNVQKQMNDYLHLFAQFYPCRECSDHMTTYMHQNPPKTQGRDALQYWISKLHNDVNAKLGKKQYDLSDISKVNKRWGADEGICKKGCNAT